MLATDVLKRVALGAALLPLSGCYDFPVALDPEPTMEVDSRLLGVWACLPAEPDLQKDGTFEGDARPGVLTFEHAGRWYRVKVVGMDERDKVQHWDAYASTLATKTVLNAWPRSDKPEEGPNPVTLVAQTWLSNSVLQLDLMDSTLLKGQSMDSSSTLRRAILSHRPQTDIFTPFLVCVRAKVSDSAPGSGGGTVRNRGGAPSEAPARRPPRQARRVRACPREN